METIIAAAITGLLALLGVVITNRSSCKKIAKQTELQLQTSQALMNQRLDELTREVREHNNFARRMPVVEQKIENIEEKITYFHFNKTGE